MMSISENESLNPLILSQILSEDIYIIPEAKAIQGTKTEVTEKKVTTEKPVAAKTEKEKPACKDIVVVLDKPAGPDEMEFLSRILGALKMTLQDVSILSKEEFSADMSFKKLLAFNVNTETLNPLVKTEKYLIKEHGKSGFLYADSLAELNMDTKKKKLLWDALQLMFIKK
jgi:hypothetical protein